MLGFIKNILKRMRIAYIHQQAISCDELPQKDRILIIAPHPDDEVIGCAGLIQQLIAAGKEVNIIVLTGGEGSHRGCCQINPEELKRERRKLAVNTNIALGVRASQLHFLDYKDGYIKLSSKETPKLERLIQQINPDALFIPHHFEGWNDHIEVRNIIKEIVQPNADLLLYEYCVWLWYYNVWKIDWKNAYILSMSAEEQQKKNEAINSYITPLAACGKPYSGVLPKLFIQANRWNKELFFKL